MLVGRLVVFWDGPISGDILIFGGVYLFLIELSEISITFWIENAQTSNLNFSGDFQDPRSAFPHEKNKNNPFLVGGFNPSEKYARQIGLFPQFSGWKKKSIWNHHPALTFRGFCSWIFLRFPAFRIEILQVCKRCESVWVVKTPLAIWVLGVYLYTSTSNRMCIRYTIVSHEYTHTMACANIPIYKLIYTHPYIQTPFEEVFKSPFTSPEKARLLGLPNSHRTSRSVWLEDGEWMSRDIHPCHYEILLMVQKSG